MTFLALDKEQRRNGLFMPSFVVRRLQWWERDRSRCLRGDGMMMMKSIAILAVFVLGTSSGASAATIVDFTGNSFPSLATGTASITLDPSGTFITGTLTNTSPFDARVTGFGFELGPGNLNGFTGDPATSLSNPKFSFGDGDLKNVPQFNTSVLDFGYITGPNFPGGSPNEGLDNFQTFSFVVTGAFGGLTEAEIASGLLVRFQRVGEEGNLSDVAAVDLDVNPLTPVPEPASMMLLGTGLVYLARRRYKSQPKPEGL